MKISHVRQCVTLGALLGMLAGGAAMRSSAATRTAPATTPPAAGAGAPVGFPFHDGDRVVFLGDSITEQRLYTTYLETYLLTRFPSWSLQFRNAGWGGDTSWLRQRGLPADQALVRDVLDLHPTVVTIDFSMNDAGYGAFNQDLYNQHVHGEDAIVRQLKQAGVRPIVLSVSAFEPKETGDPMVGYNQNLEQFVAGDEMVAHNENVPFADQFHPFIRAIERMRTIDPNARISGDTVHPGPPGHLGMADYVLKALDAPALVSSATVDAASGRVVNTTNCTVAGVTRSGGGVTLHRLDDALVFPIEPAARPILQVVPVVSDIDQYMLQVQNLPPAQYIVTVDDAEVARFSQSDLAAGVNLAYYPSPLSDPGMAILHEVYNKNNMYFDLWRNVRLKNDADHFAREDALSHQIADEEQKINTLRVPKVYEISVMPVPPLKAPAVTTP